MFRTDLFQPNIRILTDTRGIRSHLIRTRPEGNMSECIILRGAIVNEIDVGSIPHPPPIQQDGYATPP